MNALLVIIGVIGVVDKPIAWAWDKWIAVGLVILVFSIVFAVIVIWFIDARTRSVFKYLDARTMKLEIICADHEKNISKISRLETKIEDLEKKNSDQRNEIKELGKALGRDIIFIG